MDSGDISVSSEVAHLLYTADLPEVSSCAVCNRQSNARLRVLVCGVTSAFPLLLNAEVFFEVNNTYSAQRAN